MGNKYAKNKEVCKFYYDPPRKYFAVIANELKKLDHVKRLVIHHYLGEEVTITEVARAHKGLYAKMIHMTENLAALISHDQVNGTISDLLTKEVDIELSPRPLGTEKKNELIDLINYSK